MCSDNRVGHGDEEESFVHDFGLVNGSFVVEVYRFGVNGGRGGAISGYTGVSSTQPRPHDEGLKPG